MIITAEQDPQPAVTSSIAREDSVCLNKSQTPHSLEQVRLRS